MRQIDSQNQRRYWTALELTDSAVSFICVTSSCGSSDADKWKDPMPRPFLNCCTVGGEVLVEISSSPGPRRSYKRYHAEVCG